jgi:hypothetical protein
MTTSPFVFSSDNLPRLKAKQLSKAFPFLKLSAAQEATARALGYSSWYECIHRGAQRDPSLSDQDAGLPVRVRRYYHQANVLMELGITPAEADRWVRAWGLTGRPTLAPEEALPLYYAWNDALERLERGEVDENQLLDECGDHSYSKYPEIDHPQRVCPGVILGPTGKYPHYAVDPAINARIPIYLRGPQCLYHYEDDGDVLAMCVPGFPKDRESHRIFPRLNRIQYEWHLGEKHPEARELCVPKLVAAALARPDAVMVISQRAMPQPDGKYDFDRFAVACLRGKDFAAFLREKGAIDPSAVIWYRDVQPLRSEWDMWLHSGGWTEDFAPLPVFEAADKHQPGLPVYSYPFMTAPMSTDEYRVGMERVCLLPLSEDYDEGDEDDFDGDPDAPDGPEGPLLERDLTRPQPA